MGVGAGNKLELAVKSQLEWKELNRVRMSLHPSLNLCELSSWHRRETGRYKCLALESFLSRMWNYKPSVISQALCQDKIQMQENQYFK